MVPKEMQEQKQMTCVGEEKKEDGTEGGGCQSSYTDDRQSSPTPPSHGPRSFWPPISSRRAKKLGCSRLHERLADIARPCPCAGG